jgi:hypothetical protein
MYKGGKKFYLQAPTISWNSIHLFFKVFKCGKKFKAQIQTHGVQHYLGLYDTEEEAARAYDNHARVSLSGYHSFCNY